jgi:hypothetical protein
MCGIEYEEFPARIAEVAMWLMDHQMNMMISNEFGQYFARLPLKKSAKIVHGDALETDWEEVVPKDKLSFIIGNPPFIGSKIMSQFQRNQIVKEFNNITGCGVLDYVTGWYLKAAKYIQGTKIKVAFVSTNSIVQGEQTSILWGQMLNKYGIKIHFAHRTFRWSNEAKGNAAVYCVIIGFANIDSNDKRIFEYEDIKGEAHEIKAKNINPYLVDAKDVFIEKRSKPISNVAEMTYGSMANDGGYLLLSDNEKNELVEKDPNLLNVLRPFLGSQEFINGIKRWCIWLKNIPPNEYSKSKEVLNRIQAVKEYRLKSTRLATNKLADYPMLFGEIRQPESNYLLIPGVSSENRKYIPIGYLNKDIIASDLARTIPSASLYLFGQITSSMHMTWVKYVCGRLKSDFRYSNSLVYNNYPFPENPTEKQIKTIEEKAQNVLEVRALFPTSSLADLYSPLTMPPALVKAHNELDKAVDAAYSKQTFSSEAKRMEFLFELYEKYTAGLFVKEKKVKKKV